MLSMQCNTIVDTPYVTSESEAHDDEYAIQNKSVFKIRLKENYDKRNELHTIGALTLKVF